jgi:hypothetical protein
MSAVGFQFKNIFKKPTCSCSSSSSSAMDERLGSSNTAAEEPGER